MVLTCFWGLGSCLHYKIRVRILRVLEVVVDEVVLKVLGALNKGRCLEGFLKKLYRAFPQSPSSLLPALLGSPLLPVFRHSGGQCPVDSTVARRLAAVGSPAASLTVHNWLC